MFITSVYDYVPRQIVTVLTIDSVRKFAPVYSKPLVLHKGVDNKLSFQFLNNEQKPVNITDKEILCRIIDYTGKKILLTKILDLEFALTGIASLNLSAEEIQDISPQKAFYSLEIPKNDKNYPVYLTQNAAARGEMSIVNSVLPSFVPSEIITIPTSNPNINNSLTPDIVYYSSVHHTNSLVTTLQFTFEEFAGLVTIQGSSTMDNNWYDILETEYEEEITEVVGFTIKGYHPFMRIKFESDQGMVTNILVR
jgi:hypothetical protein